jgi:ferredoxin
MGSGDERVMGELTISADRDVCIGSGMCVFTAPGTFEQDGEAKVVVLTGTTDDLETVRAAVESCPTGALKLVNEAEGD